MLRERFGVLSITCKDICSLAWTTFTNDILAGVLLNLCSKARMCAVAVFTCSTLTCCSEGCGGVQDPTNNGQEQQ